MQQILLDVVYYAVLTLLVVVNALGVLMVLFQLPGTWVILFLTAVVALIYSDTVELITLAPLLGLAIIGEVIEFTGSSLGAKRAGASKRAMVLATGGSILGAIAGTFTPLGPIGTLLGACFGAAAGALGGDRWAGRTWDESMETGRGAAVGRLWSTIAKVGVAGVMWVVVIVALIV